MHDEGIERRSFFGLKYTAHRLGVERISTQTVNGLRRKRDQSSLLQNQGGFFDILRVRRAENLCSAQRREGSWSCRINSCIRR